MAHTREVRLTWDRRQGRFLRGKKPATTGRFIRGPIPFGWISRAALLPGSALTVGLCLWHLAGLRGTRQQLALSTERLEPLGVSRYAKDRALRSLLAAGLVTVERKRGRSPRVSIVCERQSKPRLSLGTSRP